MLPQHTTATLQHLLCILHACPVLPSFLPDTPVARAHSHLPPLQVKLFGPSLRKTSGPLMLLETVQGSNTMQASSLGVSHMHPQPYSSSPLPHLPPWPKPEAQVCGLNESDFILWRKCRENNLCQGSLESALKNSLSVESQGAW